MTHPTISLQREVWEEPAVSVGKDRQEDRRGAGGDEGAELDARRPGRGGAHSAGAGRVPSSARPLADGRTHREEGPGQGRGEDATTLRPRQGGFLSRLTVAIIDVTHGRTFWHSQRWTGSRRWNL